MSLIVLIGVVVGQDTEDDIKSCYDLGFRPSKFSETTNKPKQYRMKDFCGNNRSTITKVYCDTLTDGGGWLVVQRRIDGSENFDRDWTEYEEGFGTLPVDDNDTSGEFWLGLYSLHYLIILVMATGNYILTTSSLMEQEVICHTVTSE